MKLITINITGEAYTAVLECSRTGGNSFQQLRRSDGTWDIEMDIEILKALLFRMVEDDLEEDTLSAVILRMVQDNNCEEF